MPTTHEHTHRPLWVAGLGVIATCRSHYGQIIDRAGVPNGGTR